MNQLRMLAFILCIAFGMLRLAKAEGRVDYFAAAATTGIDCAVVEGLVRYIERRKRIAAAFRAGRAQIDALTNAIAEIDLRLGANRDDYQRLHEQLKEREARVFDVEQACEDIGWAVEAAYRSAINANRRLLEGGSLLALTPRVMSLDGEARP